MTMQNHLNAILRGMCLLLAAAGCLRETPSSSIRTESLIAGTWFIELSDPNPDQAQLNARFTVHFNPNGQFTASGGFPGLNISDLTGRYWGEGAYIATRATGKVEGIHVSFMHVNLAETPERLVLTEVKPDHMSSLVAGTNLVELSSSEISDLVTQLNTSPPGPSQLGFFQGYTAE